MGAEESLEHFQDHLCAPTRPAWWLRFNKWRIMQYTGKGRGILWCLIQMVWATLWASLLSPSPAQTAHALYFICLREFTLSIAFPSLCILYSGAKLEWLGEQAIFSIPFLFLAPQMWDGDVIPPTCFTCFRKVTFDVLQSLYYLVIPTNKDPDVFFSTFISCNSYLATSWSPMESTTARTSLSPMNPCSPLWLQLFLC